MLDATTGTLVTYNPKAVAPDTTFDELQKLMEQLQVRHLPVIDEEHRVVGLVSERDLARASTMPPLRRCRAGRRRSMANGSNRSWPSR